MSLCLSCRGELAPSARFCPSCGAAVSSVHEMLTAADATPDPRHNPAARPMSSGHSSPVRIPASTHTGGFAPGAILAERHRIVGLLGRGGMGDVYRADDLKLGQPVALKFLPAALAKDASLLERFHSEVRNARQVSHPNVCRVYDIGEVPTEAGPQHFLSMEYIDGEDLASLLRRIGRLPADKALEIMRQLCAGVAAAHDRGVLHRDLKPANVMLDGRGQARITDFGLAVAADDSRAEFAGTPAYMAPEQLEGKPATAQSDIYSLGLVFYELFTGRRPFKGESIADWRHAHLESSPQLPSSLTGEIDPAVERAIMRCLAKDPTLRPKSVAQLALSLPGGDPLAAALAAGETPSPEMVAAAAPEMAISVRLAVGAAIAIVVLLLALVPFQRRAMLLSIAPMAKSPDSLHDRARDIAKHFGYSSEPRDSAWWLDAPTTFFRYEQQHAKGNWYRDLASSWPAPVRFIYRQSPAPMQPQRPVSPITANEPPLATPEMVSVTLDSEGRLITFRAVPPIFEPKDAAPAAATAAPPAAKFDWSTAFKEADLDMATFHEAAPLRIPPFAFDQRGSWEGDVNGVPFRIDAAAFRGKLVAFDLAGPWAQAPVSSATDQAQDLQNAVSALFLIFVVPFIATLMARRNLRMRRGDTAGAMRVAVFVTVCATLQFLFGIHVAVPGSIFNGVIEALGMGLFFGAIAWVSYVALEPLVRRQAPHLLISWTRLLSGRFNDSRVGRDVLAGILGATFIYFVSTFGGALGWWNPAFATPPGIGRGLVRGSAIATQFANGLWSALFIALIFLFVIALFHSMFKKIWPGLLIQGIFFALPDFSQHGLALAQNIGVNLVVSAICMLTLGVLGPLAFAAMLAVLSAIQLVPLDLHGDSWYFGQQMFILAFVGALTFYALRASLAGRPVFRDLLDEN